MGERILRLADLMGVDYSLLDEEFDIEDDETPDDESPHP